MTGRLKLSSTVPRSSRCSGLCTGSSKSHCHVGDLELDLRAVGSGGHLAPSSALCRLWLPHCCASSFQASYSYFLYQGTQSHPKPSDAKCKHMPIEPQALQPLLSTGLPSRVSTAEAQVTGDLPSMDDTFSLGHLPVTSVSLLSTGAAEVMGFASVTSSESTQRLCAAYPSGLERLP